MEPIGSTNIRILTDAWLDSLLEGLPSESVLARQQVLSERFLKRMDLLIYGRRRPVHQIKKRLLIAAVIAAILASTVSVYAYRDTVGGFFVKVFEKFTSIVFQQPTEPSNGETRGTQPDIRDGLPKVIPDGYQLSEQIIVDAFVELVYANDAGDELIYDKMPKGGAHVSINTEGVEYEELSIGGFKAIFYANLGMRGLVWEDDYYAYTLVGVVSREDLIRMAESQGEGG